MQIWHISVLNESFHINHEILADFPNLPQMLMALIPVAAPCQAGKRAHVGCCGYCTLFMRVLWAPLLFEERAAFQTTGTVSAQDLQSSSSSLMVITGSMQERFQQLSMVFFFGARAVELHDLGISWLLHCMYFSLLLEGNHCIFGRIPKTWAAHPDPSFFMGAENSIVLRGSCFQECGFLLFLMEGGIAKGRGCY